MLPSLTDTPQYHRGLAAVFAAPRSAILRQTGWRALGCGLGLGVLAAGAIPPFTLIFLLPIAISGLLLLIDAAPGWHVASARGLAFGIGYYLASLYWVTNAILVMAAEFWWAVPIAVPLLSTVLALFIAAACAVARLAPQGWRRAGMLAGAWVLGDIARQFILSGFPWNLLGSATELPGLPGLLLMQPAAWIGVHGLTFFAIALAATPALGRRHWPAALAFLALWIAVGAIRLLVSAAAPNLIAVIVQGNVPEAEHRDHGGENAWSEQIFDRHLALTRQGMKEAAGKPAMVIWPETASPFALETDRGARLAIAEAAAPALATLAGTERFETPTIAHNSLVAVTQDGGIGAIYDKSHLVPFGEYFPGYSNFLLGEQGFVPGPGIRTLHIPGVPPVGPLICYEAIFPGQVVQPGHRPAMFVNITNDSWFGDSAGPRQHLASARMRTIEEGLPMLRAANTGISAVIDAHGRITAELGLGKQGVLVTAVPASLAPTLFSRFGLLVPLFLATFGCMICGLRATQKG